MDSFEWSIIPQVYDKVAISSLVFTLHECFFDFSAIRRNMFPSTSTEIQSEARITLMKDEQALKSTNTSPGSVLIQVLGSLNLTITLFSLRRPCKVERSIDGLLSDLIILLTFKLSSIDCLYSLLRHHAEFSPSSSYSRPEQFPSLKAE